MAAVPAVAPAALLVVRVVGALVADPVDPAVAVLAADLVADLVDLAAVARWTPQ